MNMDAIIILCILKSREEPIYHWALSPSSWHEQNKQTWMTFTKESCKDLSTHTKNFTMNCGKLNLNRQKTSKCTSRKDSLLLHSQEEANTSNAHEHRLNAGPHNVPRGVGSWVIRRGWDPAVQCDILCYEELLRMYSLRNICFYKSKKRKVWATDKEKNPQTKSCLLCFWKRKQ